MRLGLGLGVNSITSQKIGAGFTGILDEYSGAAAAYSVRRLSSTYTDGLIRVRRSSDDTEQDIGFDSNGDLDSTALLAFVNESGNAYTSDFTSTEDLFEANGTGAAAQSVGGVDDAYKFTLSGGSNSHFSGLANFIDTGANVSVSFDYYIPSTNSKVDTIGLYSCTPTLSETQIDQWASVSNFETTLNSDDFYFFARKGTDPVSTLDADGDVFYLKNIVVTQTTADGYVTTFYDQSGNGNNATNATASEQPLVVSGGSVVTENGKAAIDFDGSAQVLQNSVGASDLSNVSMFVTAGISQTNDDATIVTYPDIGTNGGVSIGQGGVGTAAQIGLRYRISGVEIDTDGIALTTGQKLLSALCTASTTAELFENGTAGALNVSARLNFSNFEIGAAGNSAFHFDGTIQEVVIFESDQSTNREDIEKNINNHFKIYS